MRRSFLVALVVPWIALFAPGQRARAAVDAVDEDEPKPAEPQTAAPPGREPVRSIAPPPRETPRAKAPPDAEPEAEPRPPRQRHPAAQGVAPAKQPVGPTAAPQPVAAPPPGSPPASGAPSAKGGPAPPPGSAPPAPPLSPKGPILLPKGGFADLLAAFRARDKALVEQNLAQVKAQSQILRELRETLGFTDLFTTADALSREAARELHSGLFPQALDSAALAVTLAPDLPEGWWMQGRAQLAALGVGGIGKAAASFLEAARAEIREPRYARVLAGNLAASAVLAALIAAGLTLALFLTMSLRYALHDFHHLFPKAASPVQTALLGAILLAIPWLFHLGTFATLASFALTSWLYLQARERITAVLALAAILATPLSLAEIARWVAFSPLGEDLYTADRDLDSELAAARLQALADGGKPIYPVLVGLAGRAKRLGRYAEATKLYRRALEAFPGRADAETNLGNVLFIQGDLEGAKSLYEAAISHDPGLAAAYFDLGQLFNRLLLLEQSQQAQHQALDLDRSLIEPHVAADDLRANRYLIDVALPWSEIAGADAEDVAGGMRTQAEVRLFGPLAGAEPGVAAALALLLAALGFGKRRLRPCSQCVKCGRPVCSRCDPGLAGEGLCGQCVNVFIRRSASDPPARIRKEARVRAYQSFRQSTLRALAVALGGAGHLASGRPLEGIAILWVGAFLLLNATGAGDFLRSPVPGAWAVRFALFALPLLPLYALSVRSVFQEQR
ncbi:MAG: tetratricopeptide repeat protein [Myxococcales bacterium]